MYACDGTVSTGSPGSACKRKREEEEVQAAVDQAEQLDIVEQQQQQVDQSTKLDLSQQQQQQQASRAVGKKLKPEHIAAAGPGHPGINNSSRHKAMPPGLALAARAVAAAVNVSGLNSAAAVKYEPAGATNAKIPKQEPVPDGSGVHSRQQQVQQGVAAVDAVTIKQEQVKREGGHTLELHRLLANKRPSSAQISRENSDLGLGVAPDLEPQVRIPAFMTAVSCPVQQTMLLDVCVMFWTGAKKLLMPAHFPAHFQT